MFIRFILLFLAKPEAIEIYGHDVTESEKHAKGPKNITNLRRNGGSLIILLDIVLQNMTRCFVR